ncbi:MAG TPA: TM0106 family RecB-like putative nuclease, partial [Acidimicrobiia bacterium]|nr:TM0106 family RecB-like putative nuclease [Acidimicrobiia bacterium]
MHVLDSGSIALSPSDLTGFAACEHLTQLELAALRGDVERPKRDDPMLDVLSRRGGEHETKQLARFRAEGRIVVEVEYPDNTAAALADAEARTLDAMRAGADVIYQATFFHDGWRGHADFLLRVDTPSPHLGAWSYEVADAKLARRVKAAALLQMCAYSEQVERLQGVAPQQMHVITGDGEQHPFKLTDYSAYYRALKARFGELVERARTDPGITTYPDPVDHCGICRWADVCKSRRRADDHLSLVSGMRRDQTRKLTAVGIATRRDLAVADPELTVAGIGEATDERLRHPAELQVKGEGHEPPIFELLPPEPPAADGPDHAWPQRGWALLPSPSPGDLYFDMEGDPFTIDDDVSGPGLEYLFGVAWHEPDGAQRYRAFWAHTRAEEKEAFEAFV